jgi:hypothetical protein
VADANVVIEHLSTNMMYASAMTKPMQEARFEKERRELTDWEGSLGSVRGVRIFARKKISCDRKSSLLGKGCIVRGYYSALNILSCKLVDMRQDVSVVYVRVLSYYRRCRIRTPRKRMGECDGRALRHAVCAKL